jgi:hypothetical protein
MEARPVHAHVFGHEALELFNLFALEDAQIAKHDFGVARGRLVEHVNSTLRNIHTRILPGVDE